MVTGEVVAMEPVIGEGDEGEEEGGFPRNNVVDVDQNHVLVEDANEEEEEEDEEEEEEEEDIDLDATLEFDKLTSEQLNEIDVIALNFGMKKKDFLSFLEVDQDEAETKRSKK